MRTLIVIRHGEAESGPVDRDRTLTPSGRDQVVRLAAAIRARGVEIDEIRHSGLVRARETAELVASGTTGARRIREDRNLGSGDDPDIFGAELDGIRGTLAIVSHMPYVRRLSALLTEGDADGTGLGFRTASAACLAPSNHGRWTVVWLEGASTPE